jgi:hypothetical protein
MSKAQRIYREFRKYHSAADARYVTEWLMKQVWA